MQKKIRKVYTNLSLAVLNTFLFFVLLNIVISVVQLVDEDNTPSVVTVPEDAPLEIHWIGPLEQDIDAIQQVYYYQPLPETIWMLLEVANVRRRCDNDTYFREEEFHGLYVNIEAEGYRRSLVPLPFPPDDEAFNVFVFGGSTTYGYGEADHRTIPAYLHNYLQEHVSTAAIYNFGHMGYFSLQERLLFEQLIEDGIKPDLAIFIDGLNEFNFWDGQPEIHLGCDEPESLESRLRNTLSCQPDELCLPVQSFAAELSDDDEVVQEADRSSAAEIPPPDDEATLRAVIDRWLENKRQIEALAAEHGVAILFVIQPVPGYAYDFAYHLFAEGRHSLSSFERTAWGYDIWVPMYEDADWNHNVLNLARLGEDNTGPIYLDRVHYAFGFMDEIAQAIRDALLERGLLNPSEE